jgi:hypothetical protein
MLDAIGLIVGIPFAVAGFVIAMIGAGLALFGAWLAGVDITWDDDDD